MARDCETLSLNAQILFGKLKSYYPPNPWDQPHWEEVGRVFDNGWYDLRLHADRRRLMETQKSFLGYLIELIATQFRKEHSSLLGFTDGHFTSHMEVVAELLLLLNDLDFQIETTDLVEL